MANGAEQLAGATPQVAPGAAPQGIDEQAILQALQQAISSSVDEQGFVDMQTLVAIWPQVAQQLGINIPFETVLQLIDANPELIQDIVVNMGLAGITVQGRRVSPEELAGIATGATGGQIQGGV